MKNSRMQTKAEETAALQKMKDKQANDGVAAGGEVDARKIVEAGEEERFAEGVSVVAPQETVVDVRTPKDVKKPT